MITTKSRLTGDLDLQLLCHIGDRAHTCRRSPYESPNVSLERLRYGLSGQWDVSQHPGDWTVQGTGYR